MSCIDAPIYSAEGRIVGALDLSSARADDLVIRATHEARRIFGMNRIGTSIAKPASDFLGHEDGDTEFPKA